MSGAVGQAGPKFLFCVSDLSTITGGISVLNRMIYRCLFESHRQGEICLQTLVLNETGSQCNDELLTAADPGSITWADGSRLRFVRKLLSCSPDLAMFDHAGLARAARIVPSCLRFPYAVLIHGAEIGRQSNRRYLKSLKESTLLIANSEHTKAAAEALGPNLPPIRVSLLGLDESDKIMPDENPIDDNETAANSILIVGRLSAGQRHKGHDALIESLPILVKTIKDIHLTIAGGGDDLDRLRQKVADLGVENHVRFTGWIDRPSLHALYRKCQLFVMPSSGDGFGFVYLEAMASRKPCIGLAGTAAAEIIEDGRTGILVRKSEARQLADCIADLLSDKDRCRQMGEAGRDRLQTMFLFKHFAERFRSVLAEFLETSSCILPAAADLNGSRYR